jgi:hypothetical protein
MKLQASAGQAVRAGPPHPRRPAAQPAPGRQIPRRRGRRPRRHCCRPGRCDGGGRLWADPAAVGAGCARLGCLNIHASCCPAGGAPRPSTGRSRRATRETGVTIMQMDAGLDTGDMLLVEKLPIAPGRHHGQPARPPGRAGRAADRGGAGAGRLRRPAASQTARRRRDLRPQDRKGRGARRLVAACGRDQPAHPRVRPVPRCLHRAGRRNLSNCGAIK